MTAIKESQGNRKLTLMLLSDTHKATHILDGIQDVVSRNSIDLFIHAGDFSVFGSHFEPLFDRLKGMEARVMFVSGNHETVGLCLKVAKDYGATWIDYKEVSILGLRVIGLAGHDIGQSTRRENIRRFAGSLRKRRNDNRFSILVSHKPPKPWFQGGVDFGCPHVRSFIEENRFNLVICGHIHEQSPRVENREFGTVVVNPGPMGAVVKVDVATGKCELVQ